MPKKFYDVAIREWGSERKSRYLPVTKVLPKEWKYVRVWTPKIEGDTATLKIECLLKAEAKK